MLETDITATFLAQAWQQLLEDGEEENFQEELAQGKSDETKAETPTVFGKSKTTRNLVSDLTDRARAGQLDPVIGREEELERMITVLCRRTKNNPVLIGPPGSGKSAMVNGLAQRIVEGRVPARLKDSHILNLEVSRLVAGTIMRGSFEEKINNFLDELKAAPGTILFIDELHTIVGAGSSGFDDTNDLGNFLKPFLARGEVSVIGATTLEEYRRFIEKDAALERRFQPIEIEEPDAATTKLILAGLVNLYAEHHGVAYSSNILDACVNLAARHLTSRYFPDKAIDLLDEAGAQASKLGHPEVLYEDVAAALPRVRSSAQHEMAKRQGLYAHLNQTLIGQQAAIELIGETIETQKLMLNERHVPIASLLFTGPAACGKGTAARAIAETLFDGAMTTIDLAEYAEPHSISGLIGTQPGYIGYEQRARLIEPLRHKPAQVVLFKHVDLAHAQVRAILAEILTNGQLHDSHERVASFREAIVIFTVTDESRGAGTLGFRIENQQTPRANLSETERLALRNRLGATLLDNLDEVVRFSVLSRENLATATAKRIDSVIDNLRSRGISLEVEPEVGERLIEAVGHSAGLRDLERLILRLVERPIATILFTHPESNALRLVWANGQARAEIVETPALITRPRGKPRGSG